MTKTSPQAQKTGLHGPQAVALVSGGMDSLVCLAMAKEQFKDVALLHLNYGQRTEKRELKAFHDIADFYQVPKEWRKVIDVTFLSQIGGSSLTDKNMQVTQYQGDSEEIPSSYVPFRNTHLISMAISWSEVIGAKKVYIGAVYEDSSGYPDCRPSYFKAFNTLIKEGTKAGDIEIITPVIHMSKDQIIKQALELKAPLNLSWSCYQSNDLSCGICDSCALRLRAFQRVGIEDPIEYQARPKY